MVGPPNSLSDLAKIDANPVVSCRYCAWRVEYDRALLCRARTLAGLGTDWRAFCTEMRCEDCGGPVLIAIKPFVSELALRDGDMKRALTFKALCALHEAQVAAKHGRVPPSAGLRLGLAYLFAVANRADPGAKRDLYVEFWRLATQQDAASTGVGHNGDAYYRSTIMQSCVNAIGRAAGIEITHEVLEQLRRATKSE